LYGKKGLDSFKEALGTNMNIKTTSGTVTDRNEEAYVTGNWIKVTLYKVNWDNHVLILVGSRFVNYEIRFF
jgi:hypothetical protein